jgi:hypothetical protein
MSRLVLVAVVGACLAALGGGATLWLRAARAAGVTSVRKPTRADQGVGTNAPVAESRTAPITRLATRIETAQLQSRWPRWSQAPVRDPFQILLPEAKRAVTPDSSVSRFRLLAIWLQTGARLAVVDHRVYGEGDSLAEYRILSIGPDGVIVQGRERREKITFTSYIPPSADSGRRTNTVGPWLGPERERVY